MAGPSSRTGVATKFDVNGSPRLPPLQRYSCPGWSTPVPLCSSASSGRDREFESPSLRRRVRRGGEDITVRWRRLLPFANMSGDPEQEYFADGMVEEIIFSNRHFSGVLDPPPLPEVQRF